MIAEYARALGRLRDSLVDFSRAPAARFLAIVTEPDLRPTVLELVAAHELHPANGRAIVVLEEPYDKGSPGWGQRAHELRSHHASRAEAMARDGDILPDLGPAPPRGEMEGFAALLGSLASTVRPPLDGWIVVFAPRRIGDREGFQQAMSRLVESEGLLPLRFITVEPEAAATPDLVSSLGDRVRIHLCTVDPDEADRQWRELISAMADAPAGAYPPVLAGGAWPEGATPPARARRARPWVAGSREPLSPPDAVEVLRSPPPLSAGDAARWRRLILTAALAARRDDGGPEAIASQREAAAFCLARGMEREGLLLEITLGTYHVRFKDTPSAKGLLRDVVRRAEPAGHADIAAAALLAAAALDRIDGSREAALSAYLDAARLSRGATGTRLVAIESHRMAAEIALELQQEDLAVRSLREAVALTEGRSAEEIKLSSAAEAARALAALYRQAGRAAEAEALLGQADRFERGEGR